MVWGSNHRSSCGDVCVSLEPTFQLADFRLTVRPLLVTVHFILMKKSRSVNSSLPFLRLLLPGKHRITRSGGAARSHIARLNDEREEALRAVDEEQLKAIKQTDTERVLLQ